MTEHTPLGGSDAAVYCGSGKAIAAATVAFKDRVMEPAEVEGLTDALVAAHHPRLGLDRSVCLRDVVEVLRADYDGYGSENAADFIARKLGAGT